MDFERDQSETIALIGGPKNGVTYAWRGGDIIRFVKPAPLPSIIETTPRPQPRPQLDEIVYRRWGRSHIFDYQPPNPED